jgi:hypothetical protein
MSKGYRHVVRENIVVYRIHFSLKDLACTRIADKPMPFTELQFAIRALQDRSQPARLDYWRRHVRAQLTVPARMAMTLTPPVGYSPSFLAPSHAGTPEQLLDSVHATPRAGIRTEMKAIAELQSMPTWTHRLADDAAVFEQVRVGLGSLYDHLLSPYWKQLEDLFTADRTARVHQWLSGGVERVFAQVNPRWMRWNAPVLEIRMPNGAEHDLVLEGQGILLLPSVFCTRSIVDDGAWPQPVVSYPAALDDPLRRLTVFTPEPAKARPTDAVSALLGQTRSCVLNVIAEHPGCSTKELADLAGIAPASASEHARVLREAGLVQTVRHRNTARHSPTNLGINLL